MADTGRRSGGFKCSFAVAAQSKVNILYASLCYVPSVGGAAIHLHRVACELVSWGHQAQVITQWIRPRNDFLFGSTLRTDPPRTYVQDGIPVQQIGFDRWTQRLMFPWVHLYHRAPFEARPLLIPAISRLMRRSFEGAVSGPVDLVHAGRTGTEFLPVAARSFARRRSVPYVITALLHHDWHGPRHAPFDRLYRSADAVIALTEFEKEFLVEQKGVAEERVHVTIRD